MKKTIINLQLDVELRDRYKIICAAKKITMRDDLLSYIREQAEAVKVDKEGRITVALPAFIIEEEDGTLKKGGSK